MWELILNAFGTMFSVLQAKLSRAMSEISFTADIWLSESLDPYLAITAHWIGQEIESGPGMSKCVLDNYMCADFTECPPTWKDATEKMCWDSTYFMINHFQVLQQAVNYFLDAPRNAKIVDDRLKCLD
ncbi:hypothetical protein HD554DRAFT_2040447 [Boletus coccyginus]|nr:hypothetical protein HD554DRAFT_2040447 [Boletus coccyginus]